MPIAFAVRCARLIGSDEYVHFLAEQSQVFELTGSVRIHKQDPFASRMQHSMPHSPAFAPVLFEHHHSYARSARSFPLACKVQSYGSGFVFAAIVDYEYFIARLVH